MEADRLQLETPSLSLESCTITGNTATSSPEHGAAIFTSGVPVMLNGTTVENNGAREIAVRGSEVYTIGGANQQKLIYDPSDQSLVDSIALLPEGSEGAVNSRTAYQRWEVLWDFPLCHPLKLHPTRTNCSV